MSGLPRWSAGRLARPAGGLPRWLVRRLAGALLVLFGAATLAFASLELIPGDPARAVVGSAPATPEVLAAIRADLGLDRSLPERYFAYLGRLLHGDLGQSYQLQQPVGRIIGEQLAPTAQLALAAGVLAVAAAVLVATATAGRWPVLRILSQGLELVAVSTPTFWLGLVLLTVFSFGLHWFPVAGGTGTAGLVLPAVTLALPIAGELTQVLRRSTEEALTQPFVLTARARGVREGVVRLRHVLRHALVPLVTMTGWTLGSLLGGAVVVETVFARPGLGRVTLAAVTGRDFPVVTAVVLLSAVVFVVLNTAVDLLYRVIDPRLEAR
ncbi:ABC transporter permease [Amycolatopsis sp. lyj-23]|uniref:ABC transporter permease n=1 Tax=Amycolatopsis sp. lyj-23 TaxID=2789283 RepID=UPI0039796329